MILPPPQIQTLIGLLRNGARLDGRSLFEYREISFAFPQGTTNENGGSCIVKLGANSVLARVSCEVMEPKPFRPSQGMLFVNFDASTLVHLEDSRSTSKVVRAAEEEGRRLSAILQIILRDTIDLDALCIVAWERVFAIRLELRALSFDGNLGDCGALASIMALSTYKRPDVVVTDEGKVIVDWCGKLRPYASLGIRRIPVLITIGLISCGSIILFGDPTAREQALIQALGTSTTRDLTTELTHSPLDDGGGIIMIGLTTSGELCCLNTSGLTVPLTPAILTRCVKLASKSAQGLVALVKRVLAGISRIKRVTQSQATGRQTEVERAGELANRVPLILASTSLLELPVRKSKDLLGEVGEVDRKNDGDSRCEIGSEVDEGEVMMDLVTSSSAESSPHHTGSDAPLNRPSETLSSKVVDDSKDPYGVIEISSLLAETRASLLESN